MELTFKNKQGEWVTYPNAQEQIEFLESEVARLKALCKAENLPISPVRLSLNSQEIVNEMKDLSENSTWKGKRHKEAIKYGFVKGFDFLNKKLRTLNES